MLCVCKQLCGKWTVLHLRKGLPCSHDYPTENSCICHPMKYFRLCWCRGLNMNTSSPMMSETPKLGHCLFSHFQDKGDFVEGSNSCLNLTLSCVSLMSTSVYSAEIQKEYGEWSKITMSREAKSLEFRHKDKSDTVVLWNRTNPTITQSSSRKIIGYFYLMYNLTQEDSGEYITRDKNGLVLDTFNIVVIGEYFCFCPNLFDVVFYCSGVAFAFIIYPKSS